MTPPPGTDRSDPEALTNAEPLPPAYSSVTGSFITQESLRQRGWEAAASGRWLVETNQPLTSDQLAEARDLAAGAGLTIESRDQQEGLTTLRSGATAVGMLLALGILAMTVGLIRSEVAGDVRTLTASGATSGTRRTLTAATAGGLALLGVALGTVGAYVALTAGFASELVELRPVPIAHLAVIAVGTPLAALPPAGSWVAANRPTSRGSRSSDGESVASPSFVPCDHRHVTVPVVELVDEGAGCAAGFRRRSERTSGLRAPMSSRRPAT